MWLWCYLNRCGDDTKSAQESTNWNEDNIVKRGRDHGPTNDAEIVNQEDGPLAADDVGEIATQDRPKHLANVGDAHHCRFLLRGHVSIYGSELGKEDCAARGGAKWLMNRNILGLYAINWINHNHNKSKYFSSDVPNWFFNQSLPEADDKSYTDAGEEADD